MFPSWTTPTEFEARLEAIETKLLKIAKRYATQQSSHDSSECEFEIRTFDTLIPRSAVPCLKPAKKPDDEWLNIHCIHAESKSKSKSKVQSNDAADGNENESKTAVPLVNLHGYMNAGAYFYRNLGGLGGYFRNVYAVDMLGWGLSARPPFDEVKDSETIRSAEDFFVESLEAWRSMNGIDTMILAGHSFGGYVAVAYAERYPEHVDRIVLLSPLGVPDEADPNVRQKMEWLQSSLRGKAFLGLFKTMFDWTTPGGVIRSFTEYRGSAMSRNYVNRRLPEITDADESETLSDLLYINAVLPPSGEYFLQSILNSTMMAKKPLLFRVPNLRVKSVTFMYGTKDWMELSGGMYTQALSDRLSKQLGGSHTHSLSSVTPDVNVYLVPNAGHLLILQNPEQVNACMINIAGGTVSDDRMPMLMDLNETEELNESWLEETMKIRTETISYGSS